LVDTSLLVALALIDGLSEAWRCRRKRRGHNQRAKTKDFSSDVLIIEPPKGVECGLPRTGGADPAGVATNLSFLRSASVHLRSERSKLGIP
jgi:hypothetical protein